MEVRNRFRELDLIGRVPEELWTEVRDTVWDSDHSQEKEMQKGKMVLEEALQIAVKRSERQRRKGKVHPFECRVPKNSKER